MRGKFDTDYRSWELDRLIEEYDNIRFNSDDWAIKESARITEELERRDIILDNNGNIIW